MRREVMLFEAVEYLELHAAEISATQISSALHMLEVAEPVAAPEAIERLRERPVPCCGARTMHNTMSPSTAQNLPYHSRLDRVSAGRLTVT